MRLTVCLTLLSLIWAYGLTGPGRCGAVAAPENRADRFSPLALEPLRDPPPASPWWNGEAWAERTLTPRQRRRNVRRWRKHQPNRLKRWLLKFRRRYRRRQRLRRQWQALIDGALPAPEPAATESHAALPVEDNGSASAVPSMPALPAPAVTEVAETWAAVRRGPGRPRTIPTAHRCCPRG